MEILGSRTFSRPPGLPVDTPAWGWGDSSSSKVGAQPAVCEREEELLFQSCFKRALSSRKQETDRCSYSPALRRNRLARTQPGMKIRWVAQQRCRRQPHRWQVRRLKAEIWTGVPAPSLPMGPCMRILALEALPPCLQND